MRIRGVEDQPDEAIGDFDPDERLRVAIALSRLVRPTSIALEQSAQVTGGLTDNQPPEQPIRPGPVSGPAAEAWNADPEARDWLTADEGRQLAGLLGSYFAHPLSPLLKRALWFHEFAACTLDGAVRWTLMVTGLEALVNTDHVSVVKQFMQRTTAIAGDCGVDFTRREANNSYTLRSKVSHGQMTAFNEDRRQLYVKTERLLREALRHAISDQAWAAHFATPDRQPAAVHPSNDLGRRSPAVSRWPAGGRRDRRRLVRSRHHRPVRWAIHATHRMARPA